MSQEIFKSSYTIGEQNKDSERKKQEKFIHHFYNNYCSNELQVFLLL